MDSRWDDPVGAYVPHGKISRSPVAEGLLSGLTGAVKDLFDWKGVPTGAGNPRWLETHPVPDADATVVDKLLRAGASLKGKTVTDELAYSIHGDNIHYGTPQNAAAPGRVPGGSSSGSAAAVAADLVDFALGTDTGGSVRVPAAYCGLFGLRTTHGLVSRQGLVPLAPEFDTVGWFSKKPGILEMLTEILAPGLDAHWHGGTLFTIPEADELAPDFAETTGRLARAWGLDLKPLPGFATALGGLEGLRKTYATLQGWEAWQVHGPWIQSAKPRLAPPVAERFAVASQIPSSQWLAADKIRRTHSENLRQLLGDDGLLLVPSAAGPAPLVNEAPDKVDAVRTRTMRLTCLAGLAGLPQITIPYADLQGLPRGWGLVGPAGSDAALCRWAAHAFEKGLTWAR